MIISRTFPRSASVNRSGPNNPSIVPNLCIPSRIGVFLLGLTHSMSQLFFGIPREYAFLFFHNKRDAALFAVPFSLRGQIMSRELKSESLTEEKSVSKERQFRNSRTSSA